MPVRAFASLLALTLAAVACSSDAPAATSDSLGPVAPSGATSSSAPSSSDATSSVSPIALPPTTTPSVQPAGLPPPYDADVPPTDVPRSALVPAGAKITGRWFATTSAGDAILVAWLLPGADPFRLARGFAAWRRFADAPAWRAVYGDVQPKREAVLSVEALTADVTGDGSDDALVFLSTGGSGGCGTYLVVDLAAASRAYERDACDTRIDPSSNPVGLKLTEAVYKNGDPHCCPSAVKVTVVTYAGGTQWTTASVNTEPT